MYRPLALWVSVQCFAVGAGYLGNSGYLDRPRGSELVLLWFLIVFPLVLVPVLLTLRFDPPASSPDAVRRAEAEVREALARAEALEAVKGED